MRKSILRVWQEFAWKWNVLGITRPRELAPSALVRCYISECIYLVGAEAVSRGSSCELCNLFGQSEKRIGEFCSTVPEHTQAYTRTHERTPKRIYLPRTLLHYTCKSNFPRVFTLMDSGVYFESTLWLFLLRYSPVTFALWFFYLFFFFISRVLDRLFVAPWRWREIKITRSTLLSKETSIVKDEPWMYILVEIINLDSTQNSSSSGNKCDKNVCPGRVADYWKS